MFLTGLEDARDTPKSLRHFAIREETRSVRRRAAGKGKARDKDFAINEKEKWIRSSNANTRITANSCSPLLPVGLTENIQKRIASNDCKANGSLSQGHKAATKVLLFSLALYPLSRYTLPDDKRN
uniref:Uncharacterized protein n=1 Tax=Vespula pensylvanica TaxID=30213 RepID=A0A834UID5_VESPE|nr:hypothetical protein H0235_002043 [Vespula pensylvanica]